MYIGPQLASAPDLLIPLRLEEMSLRNIRDEIRRNLIHISDLSTRPGWHKVDPSSLSEEPPISDALKAIGLAIYQGANLKTAFDYLYEHRNEISSLMIETNIADDGIPWDLTYYPNEKVFLCQEFACGIALLDPETIQRRPWRSPLQSIQSVTEEDIFLIYGHDGGPIPRFGNRLAYLEQDCDWIENLGKKYFKGKTVNLANKPLNEFLKVWETLHDKCRIIYMQGHFEKGQLCTTRDRLSPTKLMDWTSRDPNRKLDRRPIVFLNGCATTRGLQGGIHNQLSTVQLARMLVDTGASACIMTRGPVYEGPASHFAQWFFSLLLAKNLPIGEAVCHCRKEVGRVQDPIWQNSALLYTLYGEPTQRLSSIEALVPVVSHPSIRLHSLSDVDASYYYEREDLDPYDNFDRIEITLSHIFREHSEALGNRTFSDAMLEWMDRKGLRTNEVIEIGAGLGHVALNLGRALRAKNREVKKYHIIDISPRLIEAARNLLESADNFPVIFDRRDARDLPFPEGSIDGLVLSLGMLADLHSILIDGKIEQPIRQVENPNVSTYIKLLSDKKKGEEKFPGSYYLHVGAFDFIAELSRVMKRGAYAVLAEYRWSNKNSVANFGDHQECGIRFEDLVIIAEYWGFEVEEYDMAEVLGLDLNTKFLSMNLFTQKELFDHIIPQLDILFRSGYPLPVKAFTRNELRAELAKSQYGLKQRQVDALTTALDPYFHPIDDPEFESLHEDTWHYRFLLLHRL